MNINHFVKSLASRETTMSQILELCLKLSLLIAIFIPFRHVITGFSEQILGPYSDFTAISVYGCLIIGVILILFRINYHIPREKVVPNSFWVIFVLLGVLYYLLSSQPNLTALTSFSLLRIICALLLGYYVYKSEIWLKYKKVILWTIVGLGTLNALLGIFQFYAQSSLGLNLLGEPPIDINLLGVAKTVAHGTVFIRSYGFFPHPNILGAFLLITSLLNLYLLNKTTQIPRFIAFTSYLLITLGLLLTFSRAAFLSFALGSFFYLIFNRLKINKAILLAICVWLGLLIFIFQPWLATRATLSDHSVVERGVLNSATLEIVKNHWLVGTGPGTNLIVLHEKLSGSLDPWLIQPTHNFLLITISELGMFGVALLITILAIKYKLLKKAVFVNNHPNHIPNLLASICISIFVLFWFDHYFYTFFPATLALAIVVGLAAKQIKNPTE